MSRKGNLPISLPKGVEVKVNGTVVSIKGPKGALNQEMAQGVVVAVENNEIHVSLDSKITDASNLHGLYQALLANMVKGVTTGFEKKLEMIGVGFRAAVQGKLLDLQIGFSHPTKLPIPEGITVTVEKNTAISITGIDKQQVGQFAADVRSKRPPEPYKGKGIRYKDEFVRKKAGKAGKK